MSQPSGGLGGAFHGENLFEYFAADDRVIPSLVFDSPCAITLEIREDSISLSIGQRDMRWDRATRTLIDAGTFIEGDPEGHIQEEGKNG